MTQPPSIEQLHIHLVAIGGTGMAPLACLLKALGHRVTGSDGPLYPPMSDLLADAGIEPMVGFGPQNLDPAPDLVVIGNAVPRTNPEAVAAEEADLSLISMPQALSRYLLADRSPLVVSGTHGKTTTTSWATWVWDRCGKDPGYLIGGVPLDLDGSFSVGTGPRFIIEGDEYNAAYFDREAKFLHYQPETLIVTNVEFDHADLYADEAAVVAAFRKLIALLPQTGTLVACIDSPHVRELAAGAPCRVITYGMEGPADLVPLESPAADAEGTLIKILDLDGEPVDLRIALWGEHNVANALAVYAAARSDGLSVSAAASALASFRGVKRRLEEIGRVFLDGQATDLRGQATDLRGQATDLGGLATDLGGLATDLGGLATDLGGLATDLGGLATDLGGQATDLGGLATDLGGQATDLGGQATDLGGLATDLGGPATDLGGPATDVRAERSPTAPESVVVVDDFAHHPTEIDKSLHGLSERYPGRRLVVMFEPRSLTAGRAGLEDAYEDAFERADVVLLAPVFHAGRLADHERLDLDALVGALSKGERLARCFDSVDALYVAALDIVRAGDVLATMSSGSFERLPNRLLDALEGRNG